MEQNNHVDEISLRELIEILIKRKKFIATITTISILLAGVFSFFIIKPTYESSMMIMASDATDNGSTVLVDGNLDKMLDSISQYPKMNIETYKQQVKTPAVLSKTIDDLELGDKYTADSLANKITLETIKDTQLIIIKCIDDNPEEAARIANKVGENFIASVSENVKKRATSTSDYLASQIEIAENNLNEVLLEQKELLSQPRGSMELELELTAYLEQVTEYKTALNDLSIREEALDAAILASDSLPSGGSSLTLNQNTGRVTLENSKTTLKLELAEVESNIKNIEDKIVSLQESIEELQIEYQDKFYKEDNINQKVKIAKSTYDSFVKKYEEVRVTESAIIGEASLTVVSRGIASEVPVGPRKALNVAIGGVLGIMMGVFTALFTEYWQTTDKSKPVKD